MKSLGDYVKDAYTVLFQELGVFFAFCGDDFESNRMEGVVYRMPFRATFVPKDNIDEFVNRFNKITLEGIARDKEDNSEEAIIRRELFNEECFYDGGVDRCVKALKDYGIQYDAIRKMYKHILATEDVG